MALPRSWWAAEREDASMELPQIHETFHIWARKLNDRGLAVRFAHDLPSPDDTLVLSAALLTARIDPKRRSQRPARREPRIRPLARLHYLISACSSEQPEKAEQALLLVLGWAGELNDFEVLEQSPSPSWWLAWGITPRPGFLLEASVTETSQPPDTPVVREHQIDLVDRESG